MKEYQKPFTNLSVQEKPPNTVMPEQQSLLMDQPGNIRVTGKGSYSESRNSFFFSMNMIYTIKKKKNIKNYIYIFIYTYKKKN